MFPRLTRRQSRRAAAVIRLVLLALFPALLLLACASPAGVQVTLTTESTATATEPPPSPTLALPTPAASPTPAGPLELVVWWPERLAPLDNETAAEVLSQQLSAFQRENDDIAVDFRLKKVEDVGGIMATLRTAAAVAPAALPDLTLIRRDDLLVAAQQGLIYPFGNRLSPAVIEDMQPIALELGAIAGELYGLPYALEVLHVAYPESMPPLASTRLDALLEANIPLVFAGGRASGINNVLLLQYLAAGASLNENGSLQVDRDALRQTLAFYEEATESGVVDPVVLEYLTPLDFRDVLLQDVPVLAAINSTIYLDLVDQGVELRVAPIPTVNGEALTIANGWLWVVTTSDADRQARAIQFLNWMMDATRQAEYTHIIHMLPSQRTALRQFDDSVYASFVGELLAKAILPLTESESGAAARAVQSALAAVLTGQRTAEAATREVIDQLND